MRQSSLRWFEHDSRLCRIFEGVCLYSQIERKYFRSNRKRKLYCNRGLMETGHCQNKW